MEDDTGDDHEGEDGGDKHHMATSAVLHVLYCNTDIFWQASPAFLLSLQLRWPPVTEADTGQ